ncbi:iron-containing alcohol dehydrogenase [Terriglobus saanensis]|uniref:Iron-containing alcohol dehydrogenase n=1 Tax=Terriglobus saanensis (strain ATCC BAA-1853 / DSM 23119 / SP1PR4) TaxID=401053 RepID=E8V3H6_TERSS|nr:iron-containing alcohol dehydrogenase [Terriglobus saanensis]ADV83589.1 iron-containing alcohol dehydrogenase [Terriglobus saanensis SP1PR4]
MSMRTITFLQPRRLTFGPGCITDCTAYIAALGKPRVHIVSSPSMTTVINTLRVSLQELGCKVTFDLSVTAEPTISMFEKALAYARAAGPTCVLGIGGGSPLDVAKLIAAFTYSEQAVQETFGIGLLKSRDCHLVCIPSTSGTGSEVSPNAILLDEEAALKKGVVSTFLVPDATFIDPELTYSLPSSITASTGLDALTHCVEAYTNLFAHPLVDLYALQGITLCAKYLAMAVQDGHDIEARIGMSLVSLYGGLCLGPVNTAAVHALAYPLGGEFHLAHGLSNAILLPAVFRFNAKSTPDRHADVARALGAPAGLPDEETAALGADLLTQLAEACGLICDLGRHGVTRGDISRLARSAMTVTRLLKNNPRSIEQADAELIYHQCFLG